MMVMGPSSSAHGTTTRGVATTADVAVPPSTPPRPSTIRRRQFARNNRHRLGRRLAEPQKEQQQKQQPEKKEEEATATPIETNTNATIEQPPQPPPLLPKTERKKKNRRQPEQQQQQQEAEKEEDEAIAPIRTSTAPEQHPRFPLMLPKKEEKNVNENANANGVEGDNDRAKTKASKRQTVEKKAASTSKSAPVAVAVAVQEEPKKISTPTRANEENPTATLTTSGRTPISDDKLYGFEDCMVSTPATISTMSTEEDPDSPRREIQTEEWEGVAATAADPAVLMVEEDAGAANANDQGSNSGEIINRIVATNPLTLEEQPPTEEAAEVPEPPPSTPRVKAKGGMIQNPSTPPAPMKQQKERTRVYHRPHTNETVVAGRSGTNTAIDEDKSETSPRVPRRLLSEDYHIEELQGKNSKKSSRATKQQQQKNQQRKKRNSTSNKKKSSRKTSSQRASEEASRNDSNTTMGRVVSHAFDKMLGYAGGQHDDGYSSEESENIMLDLQEALMTTFGCTVPRGVKIVKTNDDDDEDDEEDDQTVETTNTGKSSNLSTIRHVRTGSNMSGSILSGLSFETTEELADFSKEKKLLTGKHHASPQNQHPNYKVPEDYDTRPPKIQRQRQRPQSPRGDDTASATSSILTDSIRKMGYPEDLYPNLSEPDFEPVDLLNEGGNVFGDVNKLGSSLLNVASSKVDEMVTSIQGFLGADPTPSDMSESGFTTLNTSDLTTATNTVVTQQSRTLNYTLSNVSVPLQVIKEGDAEASSPGKHSPSRKTQEIADNSLPKTSLLAPAVESGPSFEDTFSVNLFENGNMVGKVHGEEIPDSEDFVAFENRFEINVFETVAVAGELPSVVETGKKTENQQQQPIESLNLVQHESGVDLFKDIDDPLAAAQTAVVGTDALPIEELDDEQDSLLRALEESSTASTELDKTGKSLLQDQEDEPDVEIYWNSTPFAQELEKNASTLKQQEVPVSPAIAIANNSNNNTYNNMVVSAASLPLEKRRTDSIVVDRENTASAVDGSATHPPSAENNTPSLNVPSEAKSTIPQPPAKVTSVPAIQKAQAKETLVLVERVPVLEKKKSKKFGLKGLIRRPFQKNRKGSSEQPKGKHLEKNRGASLTQSTSQLTAESSSSLNATVRTTAEITELHVERKREQPVPDGYNFVDFDQVVPQQQQQLQQPDEKSETKMAFGLNDNTTGEAGNRDWVDFSAMNNNDSTNRPISSPAATPVRKSKKVPDSPKASTLGIEKMRKHPSSTSLQGLVVIEEEASRSARNFAATAVASRSERSYSQRSLPNTAFDTSFDSGFKFGKESRRNSIETTNIAVNVKSFEDNKELSFDDFQNSFDFSPSGNWEAFGDAGDVGAAAYRQKGYSRRSPQKVNEFPGMHQI